MESQEDKFEKVLFAIGILRNITRFVKIVPFIYALLFLICMIPYWKCSEGILDIIDQCVYVSPIVCLTFIRLSYYLKLCNWYRLQCCLPMFPLPITLIDEHIYELSGVAMQINFAIIILLFLLSLINAYFVFIHSTK